MKLKLLFILFLASVSSFAQYTLIPDLYFEAELIRQGIDSGVPDGKVLTSNINTRTTLNVRGVSLITDLTGIQDFTALKSLLCDTNQLTSLDVSKNTALTYLSFGDNYLTTIDVSKNTALTELRCYHNLLTTLDVSKNPALTILHCYENQLKALDVSKNPALTYLDCSDNELTGLNLKNGNNSKLSTNSSFNANNLSCIQVDNVAYANANWASAKDPQASYSLDCSIVVQYTLIPDVNFEKKLIQLGYDFGTPDGKVPTSKISGVTTLNISGSSITNLTGIQDFAALQQLDCSNNQLTALDFSKNIALTNLSCNSNKLTTLDVSKNVALTYLYCYSNKLTTLDVSKNTALIYLHCYENQLKALDVSKNTALRYIDCSSNQLTSLNLKNGNNTNVSSYNFTNNPNLSCIQVDNDYYSSNSWKSYKDATASYSKDCLASTLIPDVNFEKKLISLGIDTGTVDGQVPTYKINRLTSLDISNSSIINLTGIQDFTELNTLNCSGNQLTALDLSKNKLVNSLNCSSNQLTSLNLKTGTNTYLSIRNFKNNPDLTCIQVDNVAYSAANWASSKDPVAGFSTDCSAVVQYTLIPDANFEKKLIALGIDTDGTNGKVSTASISSLTSLDVTYSKITDLTGIQDFAALKILKCFENQLTSLDVSKNNVLEELYCSENQLTALDVSKNVALESLFCGKNQLTALDVSNNTALRAISFYNSQLTNLDVSKNTDLRYLDCSSNLLSNLDVSKNTVLSAFYCYSNSLTNLDVSKNLTLLDLRCDTNQLANLDVSNNTALDILSCAQNQLINLNVSNNKALTYLNCSYNLLTSLNLKNGNNVKMSGNNFTNNPNLSCIQVDNVAYSNANWAAKKDATASYSDNCSGAVAVSSAFEDQLIALGVDTDGKNGSVLLASITNITSLDVSNSNITSLSGIEYFSKLETLKCQGNLLTSINVSSNLALKYLDCSKNLLSTLDVSKNTQLTELYCDGIVTTSKKINAKTSAANQLTVLDVSKNVLLTKLSCSNNLIVSLDLSKNTLLTDVNCSNNKLTSLNLNNGNNSKLVNVNFKTNASQSCIQVDDVAYANANWSTAKDATAIYSKTACTLGIEDLVFEKLAVYPNPTKGELHIDNIVLEKASVYDVLGKLVTTTKFTNGSNTNSINLSGFPKGIYYVYLESEGSTLVRKIIIK
ncbi:T9SS type A sorting domain-containing protein [Flavobacterium panici]|uniref:Secretion system C-terminal sorting domain-containing protein n=1 Tax=Flavobacterium panici TaxID=2654843 RepID=A0A9N8P2G2_9FLAO|nr:T9SS type A sorting domain-containing protein [Flavobacterium panici]CAC9975196.1 hypothetical protein FLAPXU55_02904 [Flavobacterium panici]